MLVTRDDAMRSAVGLALTGQFSNWWCIAARLRSRRYPQEAVDWSDRQREWLDRLCTEARRALAAIDTIETDGGSPARLIEFPAIRVDAATVQL